MRRTLGAVLFLCLWPASARAQNQGGTLVPVGPDPNAPPPGQVPPPGETQADPNVPSSQTEARLREEEKEDSGLGLEWLWLNAEAGGSYVNLESLSSSNLSLQRTSTSTAGPVLGLGVGARLIFLTLGARVRHHFLSEFRLWQFNGEVGFHVRIGRVDPYLAFRGGYVTVGSLSEATGGSANATAVSVRGFNAGSALGFDYYLSKLFSLGLEGSADFMFLKRPPAELPPEVALLPQAEQDRIKNDPLYQASGSSVGLGFGVTAHAGLHF